MNKEEARKKIKALKGFYNHLLIFVVFMVCLSIINVMTHRRGDPEIWVVYPLVWWGAFVFLHGLSVHGSLVGWGRKWEENKLRQLMGWDATREELVRLSDRVETLLKILSSDDDDKELDSELQTIRKTLLDAKKAIDHYQSPLDQAAAETPLDKRAVIKAIEDLEALLTRRAFQSLEDVNGGSAR